MDSLIRSSLDTLRKDFFLSLQGGASALVNFEQTWKMFSQNLNSCADTLPTETLSTIYAFATTVNTVAMGMIDLENTSKIVHEQLSDEMAKILNEEMGNLAINDAMVQPLEAKQYPPYIQPSYKWLLLNLHNPYPSKEVKKDISRQTKTLCKDIDAWFIDARKRIGWNSLRRKRFNNTRSDILDAAIRFFVTMDPKCPLDPAVESEFAALQARAHGLYSDRFTESLLATKLDVAVKDMTPEMKVKVEENKRERHLENRRVQASERNVNSYPTPDRSPGKSPEFLLPSLILLSPELPLPSSSKPRSPTPRKRRRSLTSFSDDCDANSHHGKRSRMESEEINNESTGLLSPAPSIQDDLQDSVHVPQEYSPLTAVATDTLLHSSQIHSLKRKRRLSDGGICPMPKRPGNLRCNPRLQVASDPLPCPSSVSVVSSFNDWFSENFTAEAKFESCIPPPVSTDTPEFTGPLEIEVSNFSPCGLAKAVSPEVNYPSPTPSNDSDQVASSEITFSMACEDAPTPSDFSELLNEPHLDWLNCGLTDLSSQNHGMPIRPIQSPLPPITGFAAGSTPEFALNSLEPTLPTYSPTTLSMIPIFDPSHFSHSGTLNVWESPLPPLDFSQEITFLSNNLSNPCSILHKQQIPAMDIGSQQGQIEVEAKKKRLQELEAQLLTIRAELAATL